MSDADLFYLPEGMPAPAPDALSKPYWEAVREGRLMVQRNPRTGVYQWPPQWIAYDDHGFELDWVEVEPKGVLYSWTRAWHPVHPALREAGPYIIVVVELPHAGGIRMLGNLLGDPLQPVPIGAPVEAVFEHHDKADPAFSLVQWRLIS